ncbi:MAG: hypothetical protein NZ585_07755 [Chloracidobacterium sp.]|nr:hypothetical protein [Chloracidobacterium sp.]MDW8218095.1 hypothetical protein [Acidobacteriota bacterium]
MTLTADELFFQRDGKRGLCADATGAPGMAAPELDTLASALGETEADQSDCWRAIGQAWGRRMVERFARLLALRTGLPTVLAQAPVEPFLDLCRDYLRAYGFGSCVFVAGEPTFAVHLRDIPAGADALLAGFFEALIGGVMETPVACRVKAPTADQIVLEVFQQAES